MVTMITAYDRNLGIGLNGDLPWHFSADMQHFRESTKGNIVVAGMRTAEKIFPLRERICVTLTKRFGDVITSNGLGDAVTISCLYSLSVINSWYPDKQVYVIGGSKTYKEFLLSGTVKAILATEIDGDFRSDCYFPIFPCEASGWSAKEEKQIVGQITDKATGQTKETHARIVRYEPIH